MLLEVAMGRGAVDAGEDRSFQRQAAGSALLLDEEMMVLLALFCFLCCVRACMRVRACVCVLG